MNLLIIGGLLIVAVLAIVGAVLLSMSEPRPRTARPAHTLDTSAARSVTGTLEANENSASSHQNLPVLRDAAHPVAGEEAQSLPRLNGQFHELAAEIRTLHQQAESLERRLSALTEIVDRIEQAPHSHVSIEEEIRNSQDRAGA